MNVVITIGISILAVFLLFILRKKNKVMSDYMLIMTMAIIAGLFMSELWTMQGLTKFNFILEKSLSFYLLPAFLSYAMLLISKDNKIKRAWWWFGSFAFAFTVFILIDFTIITDYDLTKLTEQYENGSFIYHFFYRGSNVFALFALFWFIKRLKAYRKSIKDKYSYIETINLTWLSNFTWIYIINNVLILLVSAAFSLIHLGDLNLIYLIIFTSIVLSLFYLCYHGIRQYSLAEYENVHPHISHTQLVSDEKELNTPKYSTSSLSSDEVQLLYDKVKTLLEEEKIYLEPELKIQQLSQRLNATTHNISQVINSQAKKSFYDLINEYRIIHLKSLLSDPENRKFTILGLGFDSGFNSKATLNRIFKQHIGVTPREFQQANLAET